MTRGVGVRRWSGLCVVMAVSVACGSPNRGAGGGRAGSGNTGGNSGGTNLSAGLAESTLSAGIALPNEGPELMDPDVDDSITLMEPAAANSAPTPLHPGDVISVEIPFEAPEGNVVAAGIRFGDDGPIRQIEIPQAEGDTANVLTFQFEIPPDICDDLAQICHDITCYEFAVTDIGEISAANIMQLGLVCGDGCNEPTCQQLLMCEDTTPVDPGTPTKIDCSDDAPLIETCTTLCAVWDAWGACDPLGTSGGATCMDDCIGGSQIDTNNLPDYGTCAQRRECEICRTSFFECLTIENCDGEYQGCLPSDCGVGGMKDYDTCW